MKRLHVVEFSTHPGAFAKSIRAPTRSVLRRELSRLVLGGALTAMACGGSAPAEPAQTAAAAKAQRRAASDGLTRDQVVAVVDEGFSSFLQRVVVEASLEEGRFAGFRILALQPENFWRGVDLQAGDVVTAVNGRSIEQPEDAFEVFESLRTAPELSVTFERDGTAKQLVFPIKGAPQPKADPAPSDKG